MLFSNCLYFTNYILNKFLGLSWTHYFKIGVFIRPCSWNYEFGLTTDSICGWRCVEWWIKLSCVAGYIYPRSSSPHLLSTSQATCTRYHYYHTLAWLFLLPRPLQASTTAPKYMGVRRIINLNMQRHVASVHLPVIEHAHKCHLTPLI